MWANSVWGLFGLAASCVMTMLGLTPESPWQPLLFVGAILFLVGSIGVLSWPLHQKVNRVKVAALVVHPARALRLIEPSHVIILGLAIAIGGIIWQSRRALPGDPQIAVLQTQLDTARNELARARPVAPAAAPAAAQDAIAVKPEPYYSSADKDRISDALYKLQEILNKPLVRVTVESEQTLSWWEQNRNNRADQRPDIEENLKHLDATRAVSAEVYRGIFYKGVLEDYQVYADLLQDILQTPGVQREQPIQAWGMAANNLFNAITTFQSAFVHSDARTREGLFLLIHPTQDAFHDATAKLRAWGQECNERIEAKRKALRR